MTAAQPGARLRLAGREAARRTRVQHLLAPRREVVAHRRQVAHEPGPQRRLEGAALGLRLAGLERPPLGLPLGEAAVEHGDRIVAERAERPPHPRRAHDATRVIDDDAVVGTDAERADRGRERLRRRQHVRQRGRAVGDHVDVEERGAGDVRRDELGAGVAPGLRHVPRAVEDFQI